jgi:hypothetical protein
MRSAGTDRIFASQLHLEAALADKMEQLFTHALNVITAQQPFTVRWDQAMKPMLKVCQGK